MRVNRAGEAADLLAELMHGRDITELEAVLAASLDPYALSRLVAIARTRLDGLRPRPAHPARAAAIAAGLLRPGK